MGVRGQWECVVSGSAWSAGVRGQWECVVSGSAWSVGARGQWECGRLNLFRVLFDVRLKESIVFAGNADIRGDDGALCSTDENLSGAWIGGSISAVPRHGADNVTLGGGGGTASTRVKVRGGWEIGKSTVRY